MFHLSASGRCSVRLCGRWLARGARDELNLDLGVAWEGDLMATVDVAEVDGLGERIDTEASGYILVVSESDEAGDEAETIRTDDCLADAAVVIMTERSGVGEEKWSEDLSFIGVGLHVPLFIDGEVLCFSAGGSSDVAIDACGPHFIRETTKAESEFTVAAEPTRRTRACDDALERGTFRDEQVVVAIEDGARDGGGHLVAGLGFCRVKSGDEACGDADGVE